jgi:hypothetical protein
MYCTKCRSLRSDIERRGPKKCVVTGADHQFQPLTFDACPECKQPSSACICSQFNDEGEV